MSLKPMRVDGKRWIVCASGVLLLSVSPFWPTCAVAQAAPTASRRLGIALFGGLTGTYTGLQSARNLAVTAGVDLDFAPTRGFYPSAEVRGTYPVYGGVLDDQRNVLGGLKVARSYGRVHPYVDLLGGRGQINYHNGYPSLDPHIFYLQSAGNVFAAGGGLAVDALKGIRVRADAQAQRYSTPVTTTGRIIADAFTLGIEYRFR